MMLHLIAGQADAVIPPSEPLSWCRADRHGHCGAWCRPNWLIGNTAESRLDQVQFSALAVLFSLLAKPVVNKHPFREECDCEKLRYTALTSGGRSYDIAFPLHPQTTATESVTAMVTRLLATLTDQVQAQKHVSDGDILQALATLAVRERMVDASTRSTFALLQDLLENAHHAARQAASYQAARA